MTLVLLLSGCFIADHLESTCFVAGTLIDTPDGPRAIEELAVGDLVYAFDVASLRRTPRPVTALHRGTNRVRRIGLTDREVTCSLEHPFWSDDAWVEARTLQAGSPVHVWTGAECSERHVVSAEEAGTAPVFNISVEGEATYFANGILVHNKQPPDTALRDSGDTAADVGIVERPVTDEDRVGRVDDLVTSSDTGESGRVLSSTTTGATQVAADGRDQ